MVKDLIIKAVKKPHEALYALKRLFYIYFEKRVPFTHNRVVDEPRLPEFSNRLYREVNLLKEALGTYQAKRSLEIGCGYGRLTPWIADHSNEHYAIEPERNLLDDARRLYPNIKFYHGLVQKMPFPNNYFDLCVSWTVLMHIPPKELNKAIDEIKRVSAQEAIIILAEGVGDKSRSFGYWERTLEEWKDLFSPWKLSWRIERRTLKGYDGLVMRFSRINNE